MVRYVTEKTRKLHPAADCLTAGGYAVSGDRPEPDVSEWYWSRSAGPSWAITVYTPEFLADGKRDSAPYR